MVKAPRSIQAYAVVKKKNPKISCMDIFKDKDVMLLHDEQLISVEIRFKKWIKK